MINYKSINTDSKIFPCRNRNFDEDYQLEIIHFLIIEKEYLFLNL